MVEARGAFWEPTVHQRIPTTMNVNSFEVKKPVSRKSEPGLSYLLDFILVTDSFPTLFQISPNVVTVLTTPLLELNFMTMNEMQMRSRTWFHPSELVT